MASLLLHSQEVELLKALTNSHVKYLVVGGHAVIFHGYPRPAKDLDLWIRPDPENAQKTKSALVAVRVALDPAAVERLALPNLQMKIQRLNTEILTSIEAVDFDDALGRSVKTFEQETTCQVIGLLDLISNKRALGRPRDLEDVSYLESLGGA